MNFSANMAVALGNLEDDKFLVATKAMVRSLIEAGLAVEADRTLELLQASQQDNPGLHVALLDMRVITAWHLGGDFSKAAKESVEAKTEYYGGASRQVADTYYIEGTLLLINALASGWDPRSANKGAQRSYVDSVGEKNADADKAERRLSSAAGLYLSALGCHRTEYLMAGLRLALVRNDRRRAREELSRLPVFVDSDYPERVPFGIDVFGDLPLPLKQSRTLRALMESAK